MRKTQRVHGFELIKKAKNITEYRYPTNGLRVLYARIPKSPTVTTTIVYTVGSQHEQTGETGLSHMLEHMLFKPTSGTGVKWKDLEDRGAILNATTWLDRTIYYFTMPKEYLADMLAVEADRMRNLILTDKEFTPERANVLSEYEMYNSRPDMALEWSMVATAFQFHGYHHDTIGFKSDIENYSTETLREYYDKHYWPDNAVLIVAGDVDADHLLNVAQKKFGTITRSSRPENPLRVNEPQQEGIRRVDIERPTPLRLLNMAFKAPAFTDAEWTALLIALMHLADGETSVLHQRLVDTHLATSVEGNLYPTKDPFLAFLTVYATEKTPYEKIERIVFEELRTMSDTTLSLAALKLCTEKLYSDDLFSRDGSHAVATQLAEYVATGSWERYFEQLVEIRRITPQDVKQAASKYLSRSKATIGTLNAHTAI